MDDPNILLTNDDGIDAPGLGALYHALSSVGSVTVVAPLTDQSAVGRTRSQEATVHEREWGYAIDGTPVDCVIGGLTALVPETDLVVAGCNRGANLGTGVLGRSGTVSAAVEAVFFDRPAIATSMYIPAELYANDDALVGTGEYEVAADATAYLVSHAGEFDVFEGIDYLNVNAPVASNSTGQMVLTDPSDVYQMHATHEGETLTLENRIWESMQSGSIPDPAGSDRRAVLDGHVSVSPLTAAHRTHRPEELDSLAEAYSGRQDE